MLKSLKCLFKGHLYIDSRSQPGTQICVRCRDRKPFEGLIRPPSRGTGTSSSDRPLTRNS